MLRVLLFFYLLQGCTLKLTTDLSKIIGLNNPEKLMKSEEAQQIATKIGEGMGTKIMEGELLAEDMGKGLGSAFLKPQKVAIIEDPVSVDIIEKNGIVHIRQENYMEASSSFKRTNNLSKLEEIALILFDKGNTQEAADLHQYLIDRKWPIRPPYLVAKRIEREGLATISNNAFKEIDPVQYNQHYNRKMYNFFDDILHLENYINKNSISKQEMLNRLREAPVIILADSYFVVKQHDTLLEIIKSLNHKKLSIGIETQLQVFRDNSTILSSLNYLPLFNFIDENKIVTFTHGPESSRKTHASHSIDFFRWDTSLVEKTRDLLTQDKQVVIIIGDTHASADHLQYLMEEVGEIDPTVVMQNPFNLSVDQILAGENDYYQQLVAGGLMEDGILTMGNDFYLNTDIPPQDFKQYIKLFNLEDSLKVKQKGK